MSNPPNPGSDEAVNKGCLCPVLDNHHGKGFPYGDVDPAFWISGNCPLHALTEEEKIESTTAHTGCS